MSATASSSETSTATTVEASTATTAEASTALEAAARRHAGSARTTITSAATECTRASHAAI